MLPAGAATQAKRDPAHSKQAASRTRCGVCDFKDNTKTGESAFSLAKLGCVEGLNPAMYRLKKPHCIGEACLDKQHVVNLQDVGRLGFVVGSKKELEPVKIFNSDPIPIYEQGIVIDCGAGRLEMKASASPNRNDFVTVRLQYLGKLEDSRVVCPGRPADEDASAGTKYVPSINCCRQRYPRQLSVKRKLSFYRWSFASPRGGAHAGNNSQLVNDYGCILYKARIGILAVGEQPLDEYATGLERSPIII